MQGEEGHKRELEGWRSGSRMMREVSGDKNNLNERLRMSVCVIIVMYVRASRD
jgi:hypothetical protein